ncbi:YqiA/YcfP family alpha/beta fold hydrolase [Psychrobacter sp.]|uniref:YqiA/YcfP family alpha/beta fold hydrolase n=1 Tax=Psychrobacter sp. TaxID=56811 RepID=UPI0025E954A8|nr:YqiA/YcfP family alpha/beta fold hydrolase [Psychrobacter sp.]
MRIIYVHGLDSTANSVKGMLLEKYCKTYHSDIEVIRPDLNQSPDKVYTKLCELVGFYNDQHHLSSKSILVGSSLGGYFSSLVSNKTACHAVLLNPSTRPHISLQRFVNDSVINNFNRKDDSNIVVYRTTGGWDISLKDLEWFNHYRLEQIIYPNKIFAIIKQADELLDPTVATEFYQSQGVKVILQPGGDHRMTDFEQQIPMILKHILSW